MTSFIIVASDKRKSKLARIEFFALLNVTNLQRNVMYLHIPELPYSIIGLQENQDQD